ncbi:MAG: peptidoglycan-binding protein [Acidimicrobiales bacterium]
MIRPTTSPKQAIGAGAVAIGLVLGGGPVAATASPARTTMPVRPVVLSSILQAAPILGPGDEGPDVEAWQQRLNQWIEQEAPRRGTIEVTGTYDDATVQATQDLQENLGVSVDGLAGPNTRDALAEVIGEPADDGGSDVPAVEPGAGPILDRGSSGAAVEDWQRQIDAWRSGTGLDAIAVDGIFGVITANATRQFQSATDASVDGIVGPETRLYMKDALANGPSDQPTAEPPAEGPTGPLLDVITTGPAVRDWQTTVNRWRESQGITPITVDGIYGPITEDATRQFQAAQDALRVDGIVGPNTRAVAADVIDAA